MRFRNTPRLAGSKDAFGGRVGIGDVTGSQGPAECCTTMGRARLLVSTVFLHRISSPLKMSGFCIREDIRDSDKIDG
jgi:hypothetical protein